MKLSKTASILAAFAMAVTGALTIGTHTAKADGVAVVHTSGVCPLYQQDGSRVTYRGLAPNTGWQVGKTINLDGIDYYQVSTNEYLKATDADYQGNSETINQDSTFTLLGKVTNGPVGVYNDQTGLTSKTKTVADGSVWQIGRYIVNKNGSTFAQISTHEWIPGDHLMLNFLPMDTAYDADFGTNDTNSVNDVDKPVENIEQPKNDYKPNLSKINDYFVQYLNALHKANNSAPVNSSADMISYATQRANQQVNGNLDHGTAERDTSENLSGAGFDYMTNWGNVTSDKEAAYFLLKQWYDEDSNGTPLGSAGHFGHRAALIYSGPVVGLGISNDAASFDADWNWSQMDKFYQLYDYTGTNPNTTFISADSI
jgi:hypothetical protein